MIKVLVVDDSPFMRKILTDIIQEDKEIVVIGEARNGKEALEKNTYIKPRFNYFRCRNAYNGWHHYFKAYCKKNINCL